MKKTFFIAAMMIFCTAIAHAQDNTAVKKADDFLWDFTTGTFGFHLPPETALNDKISIKNEQGAEIKSITINGDMLLAGKYIMPVNSLQAGDYTVAVVHDKRILYSFMFGNKEQDIARSQDLATAPKPVTYNRSFSFNPTTGVFMISTAEQLNKGSLLEVFNDQGQLIARTEVDQQMIEGKQYSIKAGNLDNGDYSVRIGGRNFGHVSVSQ